MIVKCAVYEDGHRRPGDDLSLEEAGRVCHEQGAFVWLGVFEPDADEFEEVATKFNLHELAVEDAIKAHQRPKIELFGDNLLVVVKTAQYVDSNEVIDVGELLIFVNPDFIVTVRHGDGEL
ncbi:MAG TPA: CorA family divalent cation transporter, partial [Solirubrobacterales bacterium]|nr:CorA family divalent cation transporter [Solirubrobacterales bacterium]